MLEKQSPDIKQQKLKELKQIFPEIFEDDSINYTKLKDILDLNLDDAYRDSCQ